MSDFCYSSMQLHNKSVTPAVMATYRCKFNFALILHILVLSSVMSKTEQVLSVRLFILNQIHMESRLGLCFKLKLLLLNNAFRRNQKFVSHVLGVFAFIVQVTWLICLLLEAGLSFFFICSRYDIHRDDMFHSLSDIPKLNLRRLLYGDETFPFQTNARIFLEVQKFIEKSKRF